MAKIIFMGTPDFAVPTLKALIAAHEVVGVITQPDRPVGRSATPQPPPIKQVALSHQIPVFQPERLKRAAAQTELHAWQASIGVPRPDLYVVAAFGQILPQAVLDIPLHGPINVHASLLPLWRGAAPIQASIRHGDKQTGITIMLMEAGLDSGPILAQRSTPIGTHETAQQLHDRLAQIGAELLIDTLPGYLSGFILPTPQPQEGVTHAPQIRKEEGLIDWHQPAIVIDRLVRAFTPWPSTYTYWEGKLLKVLRGHVKAAVTGRLALATAGVTVDFDGQIAVGTENGFYYLEQVQLEGKKPQTITEFINGYPQFVGTQLGKTQGA
jgi:methionyl-tRNA formyltransferase